MKLIIVEKRDIKGYLENLKERSLEFKEILGDCQTPCPEGQGLS